VDPKIIGARLRKLRTDRGWSMAYVARQLEIGYSSMISYEYGVRVPSDKVKVRIADFYGVSVESIFYATENNET
jgi:transcriptional regulator with XRE-family HTH domain